MNKNELISSVASETGLTKTDAAKAVDAFVASVTKALKKISKHKEEDELNCGGCGYSSCREFVNALISGNAETSMCVSYMRKIAVRKAAAMVRCMPAAVVMIDKNKKNIVKIAEFKYFLQFFAKFGQREQN